MKLIKGLLAIALVSLIAVSCKEAKEKADEATDQMEEVATEVEETAEEVIDSVKAKAEEVIDSVG